MTNTAHLIKSLDLQGWLSPDDLMLTYDHLVGGTEREDYEIMEQSARQDQDTLGNEGFLCRYNDGKGDGEMGIPFIENIVLKSSIDGIYKTAMGNGKTIKDLEQQFQDVKGDFFLCNASENEPINNEVQLSWDHYYNCLGIRVWDLESYINIPVPQEYGEDFASYYNSEAGLQRLKEVFEFITKS